MAESRTSTIFCEFRPTTIIVKHFCGTELILVRTGLLFTNSGDHAVRSAINIGGIIRDNIRSHSFKAFFHSSLTRKLAASDFIQSQCLRVYFN